MQSQEIFTEMACPLPEALWPDGIEPSEGFERAYELIGTGAPFIYITGRAGTGKSTLIHCLKKMLDKRFAVVAPTGVAALNAGGQTIHSFFRMRPGPVDLPAIQRVHSGKLYSKLELLFIDEISMVRADLLDGIEKFLRHNGPHRDMPFGGVQVVAVGDLFQLPPVVSDPEEARMFAEHYETEYFFSAHSLRVCSQTTVELKKIYRQKEEAFIRILNIIREGESIDEAVADLNELCCHDNADEEAVTLTATNAVADRINWDRMNALPGKARLYEGAIEGEFDLKRSLPAPFALNLKVQAQVMFTRNDPEKRWVNGTLGKVKKLEIDHIEVEIQGTRERVTVDATSWDSVRHHYDENQRKITTEVVGSYKQLPIIPAWAITIHKSQGKTLDKVFIDLGPGAFAHGQVYVALSRCRSLKNVRLKRPLRINEVTVNPRVRDFHTRLAL